MYLYTHTYIHTYIYIHIWHTGVYRDCQITACSKTSEVTCPFLGTFIQRVLIFSGFLKGIPYFAMPTCCRQLIDCVKQTAAASLNINQYLPCRVKDLGVFSECGDFGWCLQTTASDSLCGEHGMHWAGFPEFPVLVASTLRFVKVS